MKKDIFVILLVSIIWFCKPIPYETVVYRKYVHNRTIDVVLSLKGGRSESDTTASFAPPNPPREPNKSTQGSSYEPRPRIPFGLGSGPGLGGGGSGGGSYIPQSSEWETDPEAWKKYQSDPNQAFDGSGLKNKEDDPDSCPILEKNKGGIDELPDSFRFIYNLETKTSKKALKKVWKNPQARKEILANLNKMNSGELLPRNEKDFKGFKTLKELKFTKTRMLIRPGENGAPDEIVAIFLRRDLDDMAKKLKNKFD